MALGTGRDSKFSVGKRRLKLIPERIIGYKFSRPLLLNPSAFRLLFHSTAVSPSLRGDSLGDVV